MDKPIYNLNEVAYFGGHRHQVLNIAFWNDVYVYSVAPVSMTIHEKLPYNPKDTKWVTEFELYPTFIADPTIPETESDEDEYFNSCYFDGPTCMC